jgi:hypothetical protein
MSLKEELAKYRQGARNRIPQEKLVVMDRATNDLEQSGIIDRCFKAGNVAPDFVLPNTENQPISLTGLLAMGPVVVSFYRGGW